jgi:hypothetical protein
MISRKSLAVFVLLLFPFLTASLTPAADHLDAPLLRVQGQGGRDINDVYAFQSPTNPGNSVLVMTVNPFSQRVNPFGTISARTFDPTVEYQFQIDNNGDTVADVTYATTFTSPAADVQTLSTTRNGAPIATGGTGTNLSVAGGGMVHAALFEDPFFFDLVGFNNGFNFTGNDTFAGANITAIVLEVPSAQLQNGANTNIGVWARTLVGGNQVDRMGRPAINTALIPSGMKDAFNQGLPANDTANFGDEVLASLLNLNGGNATHASQAAGLLLPDLITFDTSNSGGFLNGRRLQDDVIDTVLSAVSNGGVTTDMVSSNDAAFPGVFPYLAGPNIVIPEPSTVILLVAGLSAIGYGMRRRCARRTSDK